MPKTENSTSYTKEPLENQCTHIFFFPLSIQSRTLVNPHGKRSNIKCTKTFLFFPLGITKCNFTFLMLV